MLEPAQCARQLIRCPYVILVRECVVIAGDGSVAGKRQKVRDKPLPRTVTYLHSRTTELVAKLRQNCISFICGTIIRSDHPPIGRCLVLKREKLAAQEPRTVERT